MAVSGQAELGFELVKAFIIIDDVGNRIVAKYYTDDLKDPAAQVRKKACCDDASS